jgi:hypothetical protein
MGELLLLLLMVAAAPWVALLVVGALCIAGRGR